VIQPSRDQTRLWRVNVDGSTRLFRAVTESNVPALVCASSVGACSRGPKDRAVDESWPTNGIPTSFYYVGHADISTTMIYAHHVPQYAAAERLTRLVQATTAPTADAVAA
jgi:hypothetical protein